MSKGFVNINHSKSSSMDYYLRNEECIERFHSSGNKSDREIKAEWKQIVNNEKYGNKELGIRGRHDARVSTNYTLTLPNSLSGKEGIDRVQQLIKNTPIEKCTYTIAIHKGEKDGVKNLHAHLIVNERHTDTQKKDREMQREEWLKKEFRPKYEKVFEKEFAIGKDAVKRERIDTFAFQADPSLAKAAIKENQFIKSVKQTTAKEMEKKPERNLTPANIDTSRSMTFAEMREAARKYKEIKEITEDKNKEQEKKQIRSVGISR